MSPTKPRRWRRRTLLGLALSVLLCLWLLNVSRPGRNTLGCPEGCATTSTRREGPLRILSLNILHGFPRFAHLERRLEIIAAEIREQDADIVCLQEVPWHDGYAARRLASSTGLNHIYLRANGNRWAILFEEGEAILSRYPLRDLSWTELEPQASFFQHRVALGATAATPWGDVRVYVTHLSHNDPQANRLQVQSLVDFVSTQPQAGRVPAVVAGDFNATEDEPHMLALPWLDTYRAVHPDGMGFTCCAEPLAEAGEAADPYRKRIDYVFLVPGANPVEVVDVQRVLDRSVRSGSEWLRASDHAGLLVTVDLQP